MLDDGTPFTVYREYLHKMIISREYWQEGVPGNLRLPEALSARRDTLVTPAPKTAGVMGGPTWEQRQLAKRSVLARLVRTADEYETLVEAAAACFPDADPFALNVAGLPPSREQLRALQEGAVITVPHVAADVRAELRRRLARCDARLAGGRAAKRWRGGDFALGFEPGSSPEVVPVVHASTETLSR